MVAGGSCLLCYKDPEGINIDEASCPCGRGYITKDGLFVNGRQVQEKRVPAKRDYEEHVRLCKMCKDGSHDCFWSDEPEDYNSFFVSGAGISPEVVKRFNENHGGPHADVRPAQFKGVDGFMVKSRVKYTEKMKEELRRRSADARRSNLGGDEPTEISTSSRDYVGQSRQETMSRRPAPQERPATQTARDPTTALSEDMSTLRLQDPTGYATTTRSNPIFPREIRSNIPPTIERSSSSGGNVSISAYGTLPLSSVPQRTYPLSSFGTTSQTSSHQPLSQYVSTSAQSPAQHSSYPAQPPVSTYTTASYGPSSHDSTQSARVLSRIPREQQGRRERASGREGTEASQRPEPSPLSYDTPLQVMPSSRRAGNPTSTHQTSSYQPQQPSSTDDREPATSIQRREPQRRDSQRRPQRQIAEEPSSEEQEHGARYQTTTLRAHAETTPSITGTYPQRRPSEQRDTPPPEHRTKADQPQTSRTSRRQHEDERDTSRAIPAPPPRTSRRQLEDEYETSRALSPPTARRQRDSTREDRPTYEQRRSSIEHQTARTVPRGSRSPLENEEEPVVVQVADRPSAAHRAEQGHRREPPERERPRR